MKFLTTLLTVFWGCIGGTVLAQWQWTDSNGQPVFSDRPPATNIPSRNLKQHQNQRIAAPPVIPIDSTLENTNPTTSVHTTTNTKPSSTDKEQDVKKKTAQAQAAAQRKTEEEQFMKAKAENCARAKEAQATLRSGMRIASTNTSGEKVILDDAARALELQRIAGILSTECQ